MGLVDTIRETLAASSQTAPGGHSESEGAYWCDDCDVRVLDTAVESAEPTCPDCGEEMRFERSPGSTGCAC